MATHDEMKVGNLYLYTMDTNIDRGGYYRNLPVIALSENINLMSAAKINLKYPTWLFLLPNLTTGGFYPKSMINITLK